MIGTWVAHIPWLQDHLGVSKSTIGLVPAVHGRGRTRLDAADRPHPRRPLERIGDTRRHADLLPDAAAAAAGDEPVHARRDPVRVRGEQRRDGRCHERARRRRRAPAAEADHVVAARRLERRRLRSAGLVAIAAAAGVDPRMESLVVGVALWLAALGSPVDWGAHRPTPRRGSGFALPSRAVMLLGAPVLPGDDDRGRNRRLERHLSASRRRRQPRRGGDGVHRLLVRDGGRAPRRRRAQRAHRRGEAAAWRDGAAWRSRSEACC